MAQDLPLRPPKVLWYSWSISHHHNAKSFPRQHCMSSVRVERYHIASDEGLHTSISLGDWSQEEAESLIFHVALGLNSSEQKFGVFRHGGLVGLTKATYDLPWVAELLVRALKEKCPEAEFSAIYVSVNTAREIHTDVNNLVGVPNYLYPIAVPHKGGELWIELSDGDVVKGKIKEMVDSQEICSP